MRPGWSPLPRWTTRAVALALLAGVGALGAGLAWHVTSLTPKRFTEVVPGKLYRSGAVTPAQLERLVAEPGIRRVISLLDPAAPQSVAEREAAARLGLVWENVPLRGDGSSTPADRERILTLLTEPNAPPTLVHCAAGVNRTGLAIGLYRIHCQGWSYEAVLDEMRRIGFEDRDKHENLRAALREAAASRGSTPSQSPQLGPSERKSP
ncbi:MAG: tyrosine-protein phosphatase [Phycisphaerales bacterium]|nr:tyrosine-protein phosphatase [Phycisphaerales bacterium]